MDFVKWSAKDENRLWDVAIIGAGMGGGMAARSLADAGYDVLLIDRGFAEIAEADPSKAIDDVNRNLSEGRWPNPTSVEVDGAKSQCIVPFGAGIGGGTNLYAAALERFNRCDVDAMPGSPHPTGGWPIRYDELLPYYEQAERMLHVAGTPDPLNSDAMDHLKEPRPLDPFDADFVRHLTQKGLHPYRLHVGIRYVPGCDECLSRLCEKNCRADVRSVLAEGRRMPTVLDRTSIERLEASADRVTEAVAMRAGEPLSIRAKIFILAAGTIQTPRLLLESTGGNWPDGLANRSGLVGRNLMFHGSMRFALWPKSRFSPSIPRKSINFRDFYLVNGERIGSAQSMGLQVGYGDILMHLYGMFDRSRFRHLRVLRPFLRVPARLLGALCGKGALFSCLTEDLPYPENRVAIDKDAFDGVVLKYTIKDELRERVFALRTLLKQHLPKWRAVFLSNDVELNYAHACGTCVMGDDPATSVLDRNCKAHGIDNLFIADASFMPTSGAINPGLTIAANSLRVADRIKQVLASGRLSADSAAPTRH
jgi:choline dehydrogenase-like flavoprotein